MSSFKDSEDELKVIEKIAKMFELAKNNPNEHEAAVAMSKVNEWLVAYNLDISTIEQNRGDKSGKRMEDEFSGGMHKYQRQLWRHIAQLNFCVYFTQKVRVKEGSYAAKRKRKHTHEHRIIGRVVNVNATKNMGGYLEQTIERLCREMLGSERSMQYYSSDAVAFREGIADRVIEKIAERRRELIYAEASAAAEAARKASATGVSLDKNLTIAGLSDREQAANYDFQFGEGAWARKEAEQAKWDAEWDQRRKARAKAQREAEAAHAAWAQAHPEEAAKAEAKERAKQRARDRAAERRQLYGGGRRYRFRQTAEEMRANSGSYHQGYSAGAKVSIDPQMSGNQKRITR